MKGYEYVKVSLSTPLTNILEFIETGMVNLGKKFQVVGTGKAVEIVQRIAQILMVKFTNIYMHSSWSNEQMTSDREKNTYINRTVLCVMISTEPISMPLPEHPQKMNYAAEAYGKNLDYI